MGKSVALNDIITYMCKAYAPWELTLTLADAKVIEFKSYASGGIIPHIESIAATQDTDYIISILEHKQKEMMKVNSASFLMMLLVIYYCNVFTIFYSKF